MIEVKHLDKFFDNGTRQVLHDISAKFYDGKVNLIIGQSGSGKTVLVKNLVGLFKPEHGEILYDGRDITKMNRNELKGIRKEIGMLFQGSALFDSETVMGNVIFPLMMFSDMTPEEQRERAQFCIDRVNLTGSEHKYPAELSGGMQKRAAIARAIALNPKYLFCDEPLRSRPKDLYRHRPAALGHHPRIWHHHHHQHPRHELGDGYWRKHHLCQQRPHRLGGHQR